VTTGNGRITCFLINKCDWKIPKEIKIFGFDMLKDDLELDMIGLKGSPTNVYKSFTKELKGAGTVLRDLTPEQAVEAIVKKLEEKFII